MRLRDDPDAIDDHAFNAHVASGDYFLDQFKSLPARAPYKGMSDDPVAMPQYCPSTPFIQGITSSHETGQIVGAELARAVARD